MSDNILLIGVLVVVVVVFIMAYNKFVRLIEAARNAEKEISVQLDRRGKVFDSLISAVKKYMDHERGVFKEVTELRAKASDPNVSKEEAQNAEQELSKKVSSGELSKGINVTLENYPDLKANTNMLQLQEEIVSTENKLTFAKKGFNNAVEKYFVASKSFPALIVPAIFKNLNIDFKYWSLPEEEIQQQEERRVEF